MGSLGLRWLERIPQGVSKMFPPELKERLLQYIRMNGNPQQLLDLFI